MSWCSRMTRKRSGKQERSQVMYQVSNHVMEKDLVSIKKEMNPWNVTQKGHIKWKGWGILCAVTDTAWACTTLTPIPHPNNTNTTSQWHQHHTLTTPPLCPNDTNIMSQQYQYCIPMMPILPLNNTNPTATLTIVDLCSYSNVYRPCL